MLPESVVKPEAFILKVEMIQKVFIQEKSNGRMKPEMSDLLAEFQNGEFYSTHI